MDKGFLLFILVGTGFLYFVTTFIGSIQKENKIYQNNAYEKKYTQDQYQKIDSIGQNILDVRIIDAESQIYAWKASSLKQELFEIFPHFSNMKNFIKERVYGEPLQVRLLKHIDTIEGKFFSGSMNAEQAKHALDLLK
jgi:hypothetical protein